MWIIEKYDGKPNKIMKKLTEKNGFIQSLMNDEEKWYLKKYSGKDYVKAVMKNYSETFAKGMSKDKNLFMYMVIALRCVSKQAVFRLFKRKADSVDMRYLEVMAQFIMETFSEDLHDFFKSAHYFNLAFEIVGRDPIGRYLYGKKSLSDTAGDIQEISVKTSLGKLNIVSVFKFITICYECEMTVFSRDDIKKGMPTHSDFRITETIGEMPLETFTKIFKLKDNGKCVWVDSASPGYYSLTDEANAKLNRLASEVKEHHGKPVNKITYPTELDVKKVMSKKVKVIDDKKIKRYIETKINWKINWDLKKSTFLKPPGKGPGTAPITQRQYRYLRSLPSYSFTLDDNTTNEDLKRQLQPAIKASKKLVERVKGFLNVPEKTAVTVARTCVRYLEERAPITMAVKSTFPFEKAINKLRQDIELSQETIDIQSVVGKGSPLKSGVTKKVIKPKLKLAYVHKEDHDRGAHYMRWRRNKEEMMTKYQNFMASEYAIYAAVDLIVEYMEHPDGPMYYYGPHHFLLRNELKSRATFTLGADDMKPTRSMVDMANRMPDDLFTMMILRAYGLNDVKVNCSSAFPFFEIQIYGDVRFKEDVIHFMKCANFKKKTLSTVQESLLKDFRIREDVKVMSYDGMESYKKKMRQSMTLKGVELSKKIGEYQPTLYEQLKMFFGFARLPT